MDMIAPFKLTIDFPDYPGMQMRVETDGSGGGSVTSTGIKETVEAEDTYDEAIPYNAAIDGIESLVLALVCAGVVNVHNYSEAKDAVRTAIEAVSENY